MCKSIVSNYSHLHLKKHYTSYVRPLLEFTIRVPYKKCDISKSESVQHRAIKITHGLKSKIYEETCKFLNLTNLRERDLIQKFKIEKKLDEVEWPLTPTCGHPRGGHRGHFIRELVKSCDQRHNFLIIG